MTDLISKIEHYLTENDSTSILITGEWGSGKTFFIKNTIIPMIKDRFKKKAIYISLNGIIDQNEITKQIIASKINLSEKAVFGAKLFTSLLEISSLFPKISELTNSSQDLLKFVDLSNCVLIFDDVERISKKYNIADLLGFINTEFIEHNHYRTLFVAHEKEIMDENYLTIKEKIIEHTYVFQPNIVEMLDHYTDTIEEPRNIVNSCVKIFKLPRVT